MEVWMHAHNYLDMLLRTNIREFPHCSKIFPNFLYNNKWLLCDNFLYMVFTVQNLSQVL